MIKKRIIHAALFLAAALFLSGCAKEGENALSTGGEAADGVRAVRKEDAVPLKITIMTDPSFAASVPDPESFAEKLEEVTGCGITFLAPQSDSYYDEVEQVLRGSAWPDILLLDGSHYAEYAMRGVLWDMTESYNHSFWKSGVSDLSIVDGWKLYGKLYGIAPSYGNGYITYVKKAWLDNCGLEVPADFAEFLRMCVAFSTQDPDNNGIEGDTFALTAPGVLMEEAPYTGYLPQFYQDAYPGFYRGEDGTWRDGFTEEAMEAALWRITSVYRNGYLDPDILNNDLNSCYEKFREDKCGVITCPAGAFAAELAAGLESARLSGELVVLPPIREMGAYRVQQPVLWCITTACEEPEQVFHFLGSMMDGGDDEFLWTYGVEGVHWSMEDDSLLGRMYEKGEFHGLRNRQRRGTVCASLYSDPFFAVVPLTASTVSDPLVNLGEAARASAQVFRDNSGQTALIPFTEEMALYYDDLEELKKEMVADVLKGDVRIKDAMAFFSSGQGAKQSQEILDSLNR